MTNPSSGEAPVPTLNIANVLTTVRIIMVPFFVWALLADNSTQGVWRWVAVAIFAVAMYTDKLDGDLARSRGLITNFGKIADPIADKLLTGSALVVFSIIGELPWWVTIVILVREWGITLLRFAVIRYGVIAADMGGKVKTVLQTVAIILYLLPFTHTIDWLGTTAWIIMLLTVAVTVLTGLDYVVKAAKLRSNARRTQ
ncbi:MULTISPECIES: CDP-diacylglycerol--glycerol-3-phosphate 3-phosphatidyltransferase [Glutamicibacter]|uniref:CDP-diacylglycerol--glycerol-3-phosphate 3-phosphatidyltransferase n=1 Tax=Glutamicibacter creatinolyticus TaxID=162496 RepID=A0A5B7WRP9_9MICC|nr:MULTISPECIES: CDP-diacylglycerol--glycerol-3-phosphate 3-phosphatidyltransferase [Glutamicibacter]QCY46637.1 CDP-diacylglycerol--glycerol-3-phosphate 3-phosphatidyl-transferase 2 [Glutamicibacter creatinolyticus]TLK57032.1 CDP-diacylglycerol--glycerol-3-phosphate 3-phosphatidyltransferase [Glutamicibacter sp. V16R2B1]